MRDPISVLNKLRSRGEEVFSQVSHDLMANPNFVKAMQAAIWGKDRLNQAVGSALKTMNVPTRREFERMQSRLEALEVQLASRNRKRTARSKKRSPSSD